PLPPLHTAIVPLDGRRFHDRLSCLDWRAGRLHGSACYTRLPLRLRHRQAGAWRRSGDVGPAGADPGCDRINPQAADEGGGDVSAALMAGRLPHGRFRLRRALTEAGSVILGVVLLFWSLTPIYNMLLIALDPEEGEIEFTGNLWPPEPSLDAFWDVVT